MGDKQAFEGKIVRVERDGFGIIEFDHALGANTHGIFSTTVSEPGLPFRLLKRGAHVKGTAEPSDRDVASVKTIDSVEFDPTS